MGKVIAKIVGSIAVLLLLMSMSFLWDQQWDLTADRRNTLSPITKEWVRQVEQPIAVTMLLTGDNVPASFRGFTEYVDYFLSEIQNSNSNIEIFYQDPTDGPSEQVAAFRQALSRQGVEPIRRQVAKEDEQSSALLYPYLSIGTEKGLVFMDLAKFTGDETQSLLEAQQSFEARFVRLLRRVTVPRQANVHVLGSNAPLIAEGLSRDKSTSAYRFYGSSADQLLASADSVDAIIALERNGSLSRQDLLAIDVIGGREVPVIWCVDRFDVSIDSLRNDKGEYLSLAQPYLLEDLLFRYGVRVEPEIIMDMQSRRIPQVVNAGGETPQTKMIQYPYHLAALPTDDSPQVAQVKTPLAIDFASPITLTDQPATLSKEVLLESSQYSRVKPSPLMLNFQELYKEMEAADMNVGAQVLAARITGRNQPFLKNRLLPEEVQLLKKYDQTYLDSQYIDQVVISDVDFLSPSVGRNGKFYPIGYDVYEQHKFGANTEFVQRLLESMIYGDELIALSAKETRLALLDKVKYKAKSGPYGLYLIWGPLLLLLVLYIGYHFVRRQIYAH